MMADQMAPDATYMPPAPAEADPSLPMEPVQVQDPWGRSGPVPDVDPNYEQQPEQPAEPEVDYKAQYEAERQARAQLEARARQQEDVLRSQDDQQKVYSIYQESLRGFMERGVEEQTAQMMAQYHAGGIQTGIGLARTIQGIGTQLFRDIANGEITPQEAERAIMEVANPNQLGAWKAQNARRANDPRDAEIAQLRQQLANTNAAQRTPAQSYRVPVTTTPQAADMTAQNLMALAMDTRFERYEPTIEQIEAYERMFPAD